MLLFQGTCAAAGRLVEFTIAIHRKAVADCCWVCGQVGAIIVSPTRELARQTFTVAQPFVASVPGLEAMLLVGGTCVPCTLDTLDCLCRSSYARAL